ncbi:hypothetical protein ACFE04_006801 [Oxalis oulophora]
MVVQPGGHIIYGQPSERSNLLHCETWYYIAVDTVFGFYNDAFKKFEIVVFPFGTWPQGRAGNWRACAVARLHQLKVDSRPVQGSLTDRPWPDLAWEPATLFLWISYIDHGLLQRKNETFLMDQLRVIETRPTKEEEQDGVSVHSPCKAPPSSASSISKEHAQVEIQLRLLEALEIYPPIKLRVALLGYCLDGNERLLVYEYMPQGTLYMPQGTLSRHVFNWRNEGLKPLEWMRRLTIALDVARGVEYLHSLAHQSFIHRDLKPSNILLGIDLDMTLPQALRKWQTLEEGNSNMDDSSLSSFFGTRDNTVNSIPTRPPEFADSFKSTDCR